MPYARLVMSRIPDLLLPAGLLLVPAAAVVAGGWLLGWLERFEPTRGSAPEGGWHLAAAVPFAALTAAMVLSPVVVAVWAVSADEVAAAYLATVGFAVGALVLSALTASREAAGAEPIWSRLPGVLLTSAVGFVVAFASFAGRAVAKSMGFNVGDEWRLVVPIGVAVVVGGLAWLVHRRRTSGEPRSTAAGTSTSQKE